MILLWCPWCGNRRKPDVNRERNEFGRMATTYKCTACHQPWHLVVDKYGTSVPEKLPVGNP